MELLRHWGETVEERQVTIDEVIDAYKAGKVEEVFVVTGYSNPAAATGKLNSNTEGGQAQ